MKVISVATYGGPTIALNPPRVKLLVFRDGELPDALVAGISFTAEGTDKGRARPLRVDRVTIDGVETICSGSGDTGGATEARAGDHPDATPNSDGADPSFLESATPIALAGEPNAPGGVSTTVPPLPPVSAPTTSARSAAPGLGPKHTLPPTQKFTLPAAARRRTRTEPAPRASITLQDGTRVEGSRILTLEATGYGPEDNGEWGDQTFLGTPVGFGTVAVDPRVIPLHKHLWVEGYGFCIALDIGSAIKGKRIDLGQDNEDDAQAVGRKRLRVLVLD